MVVPHCYDLIQYTLVCLLQPVKIHNNQLNLKNEALIEKLHLVSTHEITVKLYLQSFDEEIFLSPLGLME